MTEEQMIDCLLYELVKKEKHHYHCTNSYADCYIYCKHRTARPLRVANKRTTYTAKQDTKAA
ncbi:Uncharacterised protein [Streptococcus pyogenes]|nr:Uncharacterised protein [Streptococcus pyogenes]SQG73339.1 Uncharacterised protein [Streptococcus pyogenes]VGT31549.1 Uncharacterised protein [Streptococcus pyogenes]VGU54896.1 Uncharacterised protein [Streptococcus pyogenes]VHI91369.1 Uncharacterised protein [Streptococcus pyogenes]